MSSEEAADLLLLLLFTAMSPESSPAASSFGNVHPRFPYPHQDRPEPSLYRRKGRAKVPYHTRTDLGSRPKEDRP
jgi:hypothetical protein